MSWCPPLPGSPRKAHGIKLFESLRKLIEVVKDDYLEGAVEWWFYDSDPDLDQPCIFVSADGTKKFSLRLDRGAMRRGYDAALDHGFHLEYLRDAKAEESQVNKATLMLPREKPLPEVFMSLGWLEEFELENGDQFTRRRTTNYAVLLNLTTKPASLWVAYDYYPCNSEDMIFPRYLGKHQYQHPCRGRYRDEDDFSLKAKIFSEIEGDADVGETSFREWFLKGNHGKEPFDGSAKDFSFDRLFPKRDDLDTANSQTQLKSEPPTDQVRLEKTPIKDPNVSTAMEFSFHNKYYSFWLGENAFEVLMDPSIFTQHLPLGQGAGVIWLPCRRILKRVPDGPGPSGPTKQTQGQAGNPPCDQSPQEPQATSDSDPEYAKPDSNMNNGISSTPSTQPNTNGGSYPSNSNECNALADNTSAPSGSVLELTDSKRGRSSDEASCGFFNPFQEFDLAMLHPDAEQWDLDNGLNITEVSQWFHRTHLHIGQSLQAVITEEDIPDVARISATELLRKLPQN